MILYHVTLFNKPTQEILIPRIPGDTSIGEEVKTNRICLAPSIIQCLRALEIYKYFQEDTLDVKVYKIVVDALFTTKWFFMQIIENLCPHYNLSFLIFQFIIFHDSL